MTVRTVTVTKNVSWLGLLGVIFVIAKVFEIGPVAEWSWWLVLMPFYIGFAIVLVIFGGGALLVGGAYVIASAIDAYNRRKRRIAREKEQVWRALNKRN